MTQRTQQVGRRARERERANVPSMRSFSKCASTRADICQARSAIRPSLGISRHADAETRATQRRNEERGPTARAELTSSSLFVGTTSLSFGDSRTLNDQQRWSIKLFAQTQPSNTHQGPEYDCSVKRTLKAKQRKAKQASKQKASNKGTRSRL